MIRTLAALAFAGAVLMPTGVRAVEPHCPSTCASEVDRHSYREPQKRKRKIARAARRAPAAKPGLVKIVAPHSGRTAWLAPAAAPKFQAFVNELEASGYRVGVMSGWRRSGSCRGCDMHPRGLALDIDQTGRNIMPKGKRFPAGVTAMAARHGIGHGAIWSNPDTGHFELMAGSRVHWPRLVENPPRVTENPPPHSGKPAPDALEPAPGYEDSPPGVETAQAGPAAAPATPQVTPKRPPNDPGNLFMAYLASMDVLIAPWVRPTCPSGEPMPMRLQGVLTAAAGHFGERVHVNSAYRDWAYNRRVGGARYSQHMRCAAIDFRVEGTSPAKVRAWVLANRKTLKVGGVGVYVSHVHVDLGPAREWSGSRKKKHRRTRLASVR